MDKLQTVRAVNRQEDGGAAGDAGAAAAGSAIAESTTAASTVAAPTIAAQRPAIVRDESGPLLNPPARTKPPARSAAPSPSTPRPVGPQQRAAPAPAARPVKDRVPAARRSPMEDGEVAALLAGLPQTRHKRRSIGLWVSFLLMVLVPTAAAGVYYGFIASSQYMSEFRFAVRNQEFQPGGASAMSTALGAAARAGAYTDNFLVVDYLNSRQAVEDLLKTTDIRALYSTQAADALSRFDARGTMEDLVTYWQSMIDASFDLATGLALVRVRAFTPQDAYTIAAALVAQSEKLVNGISARARRDAVRFAEADVGRAEQRMRDARAQMRQFRDAQQTPDAARTAGGTLDLAMKLRADVASLQAQLKSLRSYMGPEAPTMKVLESKIAATQVQIAAIEGEIGKGSANGSATGSTAGSAPAADPGAAAAALSGVLSTYEDIDLSRQFAEKFYDTTLATLEQARSQAAAQQSYVATYVQPAVAQASLYPQRLISVLIVLLAAAAFWFISIMIFYSVRDHVA